MSSSLKGISTLKLAGIAGIGGIATACFGYYVRRNTVIKYAALPYYQDSIRVLRRDEGVAFLIGRPIVDKQFDIADRKRNFVGEKEARFEIPVCGPRGEGIYHVLAEAETAELELTKAELEVTKTDQLLPAEYENKRLVVYLKERHGNIKDFAPRIRTKQ